MRLRGKCTEISAGIGDTSGSGQLMGFHFMVNFRQHFWRNGSKISGGAGTLV